MAKKLDKQELAAYVQTKGYSFTWAGFCGVWGGYPFSVLAFAVNMPGTLMLQLKVAGEVDSELVKALRQAVPKGCSVPGGRREGTVTIYCPGKTTAAAVACFEQALEVAANALRERGLWPPETCPFCGQGGCDALAFWGSNSPAHRYVPVHRACVEGRAQAAAAQAEENALMGNYFTGFLGALLGGLVGAIPNVLAAVLLERIFALLYALIPLAAYYGYKLCRGKMNKGALVCAIISSVIGIFAVEYITQFVWLCMEFELTFGESIEFLCEAIGDYTLLFVESVAAGELTANLLQGALFLGLGLWVSWRTITRTSQHEVRAAAAVEATLQPWPVRESVPAWPGGPETPETPAAPETPGGVQ